MASSSSTTTPSTRAMSSLSGTGTGGGPSPVTPGAKTRSATSSRRASLNPTRSNGGSSPSPATSPLLGKGGDVELAKMTRDQMQALIAVERKSHEDGRKKREEAEEALAKALEEGEEQERRRVALEARLGEKEKDVAGFEQELSKRVAEAEEWSVQAKELDRVRAQVKDADRKAREQADTFETERATWLDRERHLKSRISSLSKELPSPARRLTGLPEEPETEGADDVRTRSKRADSGSSAGGVSVVVSESPERPRSAASDMAEQQAECHIQFRRSPSLRPGRAHVPKELKVPSSPAGSTTSLNVTPATPRHGSGGSTLPGVPLPPEMLAELSELRALATAHEALQSELADLKRVNAQLMEENESYELLVGEKTLAGQLDLKSLLRQSTYGSSEADGEEASDSLSTVNTSISTSQLGDVKEEDEQEDEVEKMILESQGSGSRTTGAVEAQTAPKKKARTPAPDNAGLGLDLAAELEKAEEDEEEQTQRSPRKQAKPSSEVSALRAELRALQDANKALALYISKIIDRIVGMDGFEKVLSADYTKPDAPAAKAAPPKAGAEKPAKRMTLDWRTLSPTALFGGTQTKPAPQAPPVLPGMKPLTLTGQKAGSADDEEDAKERERLRAEMKLHGLENAGSPQLHAGFRESPALGIEQTLDTASDKSGLGSSLKASVGGRASSASSTPTLGSEGGGASAVKRDEERDREIKANLDRGTAGGFTEISRTRRRPSLKDRDRAVSGASIRSSASTPSTRSRPVSPMLPPLPDDEPPATADAVEPPAPQSVFTRAAKRLSISWGPRPDAKPVDLPTSPS